jgi:DNA-directed RNA polymerase specialized sigma24 family protein
MLMKTKTVDFHHVEDHQRDMDKRLQNWARWVKPRSPSWVSPMFRQARSNAWQWHTPEVRETCDMLDAQAMEKAVAALPEKHRTAIRWHYVYPVQPFKVQKALGVTEQALYGLVRDGRERLMNKGVNNG